MFISVNTVDDFTPKYLIMDCVCVCNMAVCYVSPATECIPRVRKHCSISSAHYKLWKDLLVNDHRVKLLHCIQLK